MKKSLIILGALLIVVVLVVWGYLMVFGAPQSTADIFTSFGIRGETQTDSYNTPPPDTISPVTDNEVSVSALRQVVVGIEVVGAVFVGDVLRFVERGTGHIYDLNIVSGEVKKVSGTTIPKTSSAVFSKNGSRVAITHEDGGAFLTTIGTIDGGGVLLNMVGLQPNSVEVVFISDSVVRYLETLADGTVGVELNLDTEKKTKLFTTPLKQLRLAVASTTTYAYTTPSSKLLGFVYTVDGGLHYVSNGGFGLLPVPYGEGVVLSTLTENGVFTSSVVGAQNTPLPISLFPEKCVGNPKTNTLTLYCSAPALALSGDYPDMWYKGLVSLKDSFWEVDPGTNQSFLLSDMFFEGGREIDVSSIGVSVDGSFVYMINKNDNSLWLYDTTTRSE